MYVTEDPWIYEKIWNPADPAGIRRAKKERKKRKKKRERKRRRERKKEVNGVC